MKKLTLAALSCTFFMAATPLKAGFSDSLKGAVGSMRQIGTDFHQGYQTPSFGQPQSYAGQLGGYAAQGMQGAQQVYQAVSPYAKAALAAGSAKIKNFGSCFVSCSTSACQDLGTWTNCALNCSPFSIRNCSTMAASKGYPSQSELKSAQAGLGQPILYGR